MSNTKLPSSSSYNAFTYVDNIVSKPIIGSDGAAKWQEWNSKEESSSVYTSQNNAPHAPIKKNDKLSTGMKTIQDERLHEEKKRKIHGFQQMGKKGYTHFNSKKEMNQSKEHTMALKRIRPDHVTYYYPASTFQEYKKDYIFTTRKPRGTGYYWDGMDTYNELIAKENNDDNGEGLTDTQNDILTSATALDEKKNKDDNNNESDLIKPKKKKKKTRKLLEQKEHEKIINSIKAIKWKKTLDESTGKIYYYNIETEETTWDLPNELLDNDDNKEQHGNNKNDKNVWKSTIDKSTGKTYYYNKITKETVWKCPKELLEEIKENNNKIKNDSNNNKANNDNNKEVDDNNDLWKSTIDKLTGKTYWYNKITKETTWNKLDLRK